MFSFFIFEFSMWSAHTHHYRKYQPLFRIVCYSSFKLIMMNEFRYSFANVLENVGTKKVFAHSESQESIVLKVV